MGGRDSLVCIVPRRRLEQRLVALRHGAEGAGAQELIEHVLRHLEIALSRDHLLELRDGEEKAGGRLETLFVDRGGERVDSTLGDLGGHCCGL